MRETARIERIVKLVYRIWNKPTNHDLRIMQLLINPFVGLSEVELYNMEDGELENKLREFYHVPSQQTNC